MDRPLAEVLQRIYGSLEVARDLLERSGDLYLSQTKDRDHQVIESFVAANAALGLVVEALESHAGQATPAA